MRVPKLNPIRDPKYIKWLRSQPCIVTGRGNDPMDPVEAAHISTLGKGIKSSDAECLPLAHSVHAMCHQYGEVSVLREHLSNAVLRDALRALAREMYQKYLDDTRQPSSSVSVRHRLFVR